MLTGSDRQLPISQRRIIVLCVDSSSVPNRVSRRNIH